MTWTDITARITHWWSTLPGLIVPPLLYWQTVGWTVPSNRNEWMALAGEMALAVLLVSYKGRVGSPPDPKVQP